MGVVVRQKEKGKGKPWWVFICHQKRRKAIQVGDKGAAEGVAARIQLQLAAGDYPMGPVKQIPIFGDYARRWLDRYGETSLKYSTRKGYDSILRNHLGALADRPLDQITKAELRDLITAKLPPLTGLTLATVTRIKALISVIFSHALDDELISQNPASRLGKLLKGKRQKKTIEPLTREEAQAFLNAVRDHYPRHYPFFLCALRTGMRLGELLALEWGDIDFHGKFIQVRQAYVKGQITTPKNGKTRRVDMSAQLAENLKTLLPQMKREALAKGRGEISGRVFENSAGQFLDDANLRRRVFWPALVKAGLRRIRIHDLRHTFASLLIQNGESLAYVRDQLGHHSIQITVDIYGHLEPGKNRQAVDRLDDEILTTSGPKPVAYGLHLP
jgi:integrase